ncbi:hypothetical protein [Caballeronia zhejiangensis]|uniref:Elements of external origin n=1 Tax=Caballeronia zhejiangensis TaxID=871203 RepID=A0A656QNV7_9BURK|nr:hypothetical protein [Caballeronia zhejiangensis]KDR31548.1 hypothetical protein BG60_29070 [Caballeronia zhejiangensis]
MKRGVTMREFARREGCSETAVRYAVARGRLRTLPDGSIDPKLVGSEWRQKNVKTLDQDPNAAANARVPEQPKSGATYIDAVRIEKNYTALLRKLEYTTKSGSVIELDAAEDAFFSAWRAVRDAWLSWPARVAPLIAADIEIEDVEGLTLVLTAHVHAQLSELGDGKLDLGIAHE